MNDKLDIEGTTLEIGDDVIYVAHWSQRLFRQTIIKFTKYKVGLNTGSLVLPEKLFKIPKTNDRFRSI